MERTKVKRYEKKWELAKLVVQDIEDDDEKVKEIVNGWKENLISSLEKTVQSKEESKELIFSMFGTHEYSPALVRKYGAEEAIILSVLKTMREDYLENYSEAVYFRRFWTPFSELSIEKRTGLLGDNVHKTLMSLRDRKVIDIEYYPALDRNIFAINISI